jgi:hypothetical protein
MAENLVFNLPTLEEKYRLLPEELNRRGWWNPGADFEDLLTSPSPSPFAYGLLTQKEWRLLWAWKCNINQKLTTDPGSKNSLERQKIMSLKMSE